jgi:hypothetical protein
VKFRSNQTEADQYIAENVILSAEAAAGDIKLTEFNIVPQFKKSFFFFYYFLFTINHNRWNVYSLNVYACVR